MIDYCKGCNTFMSCLYKSHNFEDNEFGPPGKCPCTNCVVKVMCFDGCNKFWTFRDSLPFDCSGHQTDIKKLKT